MFVEHGGAAIELLADTQDLWITYPPYVGGSTLREVLMKICKPAADGKYVTHIVRPGQDEIILSAEQIYRLCKLLNPSIPK